MGDEPALDAAEEVEWLNGRVARVHKTLEKMKETIVHIEDLLRVVQIWPPPGSTPPGSATQTLTTSQSSTTTICSRGEHWSQHPE